jgi:hypothetical protein
MSVILLIIGLLITAAGFVTIGFGIPINAFSLGNTLIISGSVAVCGGLIVLALSMVVRQLVRIAELLRGQAKAVKPAAAVVAGPEVPASEALVPPTAKLTPVAARQPAPPAPPFPPAAPSAPAMAPAIQPMPRPAEHRMSEQRVAAPPAEEEKGPLQWLRSKKPAAPAPVAAPEPAMPEVADEAPLSPRPPRLPFTTPPIATDVPEEPKVETRAWTSPRESADLKPLSRNEQVARLAPQPEPAKDKMFDVVWPDGRHTPPPVVPEPARREAKLDVPPPPPLPTMRREEPAADKATAELPLAPPAGERAPAVLKSGVIDGMAYTLYADGSIEADLAGSIVRFASVDALRAHLEKQT